MADGRSEGVMLCDRPKDASKAVHSHPIGGTWYPSSAKADAALGLPPLQKPPPPMRPKGKATAFDKQKKYIRQMEKAKKQGFYAQEAAQLEEDIKTQRVTQFAGKLRTAILNGQGLATWRPVTQAVTVKQRREFDVLERKGMCTVPGTSGPEAAAASDLNPSLRSKAESFKNSFRKLARSEEPDLSALDNVGKEMEDLVDCALAMRRPDSAAPKPAEPREAEKAPAASPAEAAGEKGPPAPRSPKVSKKAKGGSKPAWALTKEAADGVEEEEEEELLSFVDSLDYDNYIETIDDPEVKAMMDELRRGEGVMTDDEERRWKKDFVTVLNHLALRDAKGASLEEKAMSLAGLSEGGESNVSRMTESMRRKAEAAMEQRSAISAGVQKRKEEGTWDASTIAGDDTARFEKLEKSKEAADLLFENPDMKAIHSTQSARQLLESASGKDKEETKAK